jgi:hypothetical protein
MTCFHRAAPLTKANGTTGAAVEPAAPDIGASVILLLSWSIYFGPVKIITTMVFQFFSYDMTR